MKQRGSIQRIVVVHIPRSPNGESARGFCGRTTRPAIGAAYIEHVCGRCAQLAQASSDLESQVRSMRERLDELRALLSRCLPGLSVEQIRHAEGAIRKVIARLRVTEKKLEQKESENDG